ncbi:MAG: ABC transporter ATP-binding protein [Gemmatimonadetes bacterium]|nr:ABC transporter ATP-binding protein [Gemmatimonadota bacterium]
MTPAPHGVTLRGVEKRFGAVTAVAAADLEVRPGELMALVGPSGCGKSTLLRLIAGLEEPDGGEILIGERPVNDVAPGDRDVAMVFQSYALYPHMTVAGNLGFGLRVRGTNRAEIEERVERTARVLGLEDLLSRRPGQLSGGQQQRVALGRAMVRDPGVFLFDEPLSNLDAGLRLRTRDEIAALHRRLGTTMIFVTHDQTEALSLGQRVAVMDQGRILQVGTPDAIYRQPANLFVATFVGSPPINRLRLSREAEGALAGGPFRFAPDRSLDAVTLAVRPEDLAITPPGPRPDITHAVHEPDLVATVLRIEALGSEQRVHLDGPANAAWVVRAPPSLQVGPGDLVNISVAWERTHLFGPDGRRVGPAPRPIHLLREH